MRLHAGRLGWRTSWATEPSGSHRSGYWCNELRGKLSGGELNIVLSCLSGEETFSLISVAFTFTVFLVRVLDIDFFVHEILFIHGFDGAVGSFEGVV